MKKTNKILFTLFLLFCTSNSFAYYYYSLTRTDMITQKNNTLVDSEMGKIIDDFKDIESLFDSEINVEIENKNLYNKQILQEKAIGNLIIKEIKSLNESIENLIYLKERIK